MNCVQQLLHTSILLVLLLTGNKLLALADTAQARIWVFKADTLAYYSQLDSANDYLLRAGEVYQSERLWEQYIFTLTSRSTNLTEAANYDEAQEVLDQAREICRTYFPDISKSNALVYIHQGFLFTSKGLFTEALEAYNKCLDIRLKTYGQGHPQLASVYLNMGVAWSNYGDDHQALEWQKKAIHVMERNQDYPGMNLSSVYNNYAVSVGNLGDWDQALSYLLKAYELDLNELGANHPYVGVACNNIGFIYAKKGDYIRAISFYQQALAINQENFGELHPNIARNHANIAASYMEAGDPDAALKEYQVALDIRRQVEPDFFEHFANIYGNTGMIKLRQGRLEEAEADIREEIRMLNRTHTGFHPSKGKSLTHLGLIYADRKQYQKSLAYFREGLEVLERYYSAPHDQLVLTKRYIAEVFVEMQAFSQANTSFQQAVQAAMKSPADIDSLPLFDDLQPSLELVRVLSKWALLLQTQSVDHPDSRKLLEQALQSVLLGNQIADTLRSTYRYRDSQASLSASIKELFETGIQACIRLFDQTQDSSYLESALQISEKSKYLLLLDARNASRARQFAGIPDSLLQKEKELEVSITYYEKKLYASQQQETQTQLPIDIEQTLFFLKEERNHLLKKLEEDYPTYYRLKYPSDNLSLAQLQTTILQPEQCLLEYFSGKDSLYLFLVTQSNISIHVSAIQQDTLHLLIDSLRNSIYGYHIVPYPDEQIYKRSSREFVRYAYRLYQVLIRPVKPLLTERVILVPDGILGYVPFAALLEEPPGKAEAFRHHAYLTRNHSLSYAFSANILLSFIQAGDAHVDGKKELLALAPGFSTQDETPTLSSIETYRNDFLGPLTYNKQEIQQIHEIIPGRTLLDQEANLDNFLRLAPNYSLLHIATHGKANEQVADYSFIAFAPEGASNQPGLLYIRDLYNLQLRADLVVLSACETGTGELQRGEGIVSLAQGFAYAGVASMLTTLWSINDQQTALWMNGFYQFLLNAIPKDKAVQLTHVQYLNSQDDFHSHPFFWAPYIAVGDMRPIELSQPHSWANVGWVILLVILLGLGGGLLWRNMTKKTGSLL
ncbi:MAG: CHAT domain-containing tetratricopeptide repeat protein [Bacteroidota bacterium]